MPLRQQSGFSPRTQSVCSVEALMWCLTAESRLRPDRRGPTQYRESLLRSHSLTNRAKAQVCVYVCFCGIPCVPICHACFYMQEAVNTSNVHIQTLEALLKKNTIKIVTQISNKTEKDSKRKPIYFMFICICVRKRDIAGLPNALPCNLPLLHPG